jgi:CRISPR-associated protein Csb1
VFPPSYAGAVYATEKRRLPDCENPVECVLLDSVQSQANRMEEALQQAVDSGRLKIPIVEVDFTPFFPGDEQPENMRLLDPVGKISSLQAPHRIADAILRDSLLKDKPFRESEPGKRIGMVSARDATALFELCPTALIFGMWDSTGPKGGLGVKFERAMVGEIVGINATTGARTSSRVDPIIRKNPPLYETPEGGWTALESEAAQEKVKDKEEPKKYNKKLSELNLGNVAPTYSETSGGVTIAWAEQTTVLSLPALRRLRFPVNGEWNNGRDNAARTVLAALGLCAATLAAEDGLDLRSRCLLWPTEPLKWEHLAKPGETPVEVILGADAAVKLLNEAISAAKSFGLPWREEPLTLTPSDELVKLVVESQRLAARQGADAGEGGG